MEQAKSGPWRIARRTLPFATAAADLGLRQFSRRALGWKLTLSSVVLAAALARAATQARPAFYEGLSFSKALCSPDGRVIKLLPAADGRYRLWHPLGEFSPLLVRGTRIAESLAGRDPDAAIARSLAARRFADPGPEGETFARRLRVKLEAWRLRLSYSPDRLLEAYLNLSSYGPGIEGAGAASLVYFGKNPDQLNETEALELCVMPDHPVRITLGGQSSPNDLAARRAARRKLLKRLARQNPRGGRQPS